MAAIIKEPGNDVSKNNSVKGKDYKAIADERSKQAPQSILINLPSRGIIPSYPSTLSASPLRVIDMKRLVSTPDEKYYAVLIDVISELIGLDASSLTSSDFDFTVITIRVNSVGPTCSLLITCTRCKNTFPASINFTKLKSVPLRDDYKEPMRIKTSFGEIPLRLPRVSDTSQLEISESEDILSKCACALATDEPLHSRIKFLENKATIQDINLIRTFLLMYEHGVSRFQTAKCLSCGEEVLFWIPFRADILFGMGDNHEEHFRKAVL